uniref:Uncharacterized protein n=1 Tax=Molossus molossus TaxID=27622 RepID=A0A7J8IZH8_MOLMO|nr:hypothetical protein HJG59_010381 [Molossus molossus]
MPLWPSGREPAAAAQTAKVVKRPPTTFLPGPQPGTDIQPEPAVRPSRFTAAAKRNAGKCSSPTRPQQTGLCEPTTRSGVHHAIAGLRPSRRGGATGGEKAFKQQYTKTERPIISKDFSDLHSKCHFQNYHIKKMEALNFLYEPRRYT